MMMIKYGEDSKGKWVSVPVWPARGPAQWLKIYMEAK